MVRLERLFARCIVLITLKPYNLKTLTSDIPRSKKSLFLSIAYL